MLPNNCHGNINAYILSMLHEMIILTNVYVKIKSFARTSILKNTVVETIPMECVYAQGSGHYVNPLYPLLQDLWGQCTYPHYNGDVS